ncbi:hypothetical protein, partial [Cognataquiflexum rubidum]|uniref:hypothetical protein n=1 Tax=Cognataquiflexum rubidum TaxID=2922273 RepID=UPI001F12B37D
TNSGTTGTNISYHEKLAWVSHRTKQESPERAEFFHEYSGIFSFQSLCYSGFLGYDGLHPSLRYFALSGL